MHKTWNPFSQLIEKNYQENYAVLILNTEIQLSTDILLNLWNHAEIKLAVDGGANRWLAWLKRQNIDCDNVSPPDLISGDMDSLLEDVLNYFVNTHNCKVVRTPNQNETDFTKALHELEVLCDYRKSNLRTVYVIVDTMGRFDQIIANINTLYKIMAQMPDFRVILIANDSLTWLLSAGEHHIQIPVELREANEWCALIPCCPVQSVTTSGLKWNLSGTKMEFGAMVSTSNTYDGSPSVIVNTESAIIWSMGILPVLNRNKTLRNAKFYNNE